MLVNGQCIQRTAGICHRAANLLCCSAVPKQQASCPVFPRQSRNFMPHPGGGYDSFVEDLSAFVYDCNPTLVSSRVYGYHAPDRLL